MNTNIKPKPIHEQSECICEAPPKLNMIINETYSKQYSLIDYLIENKDFIWFAGTVVFRPDRHWMNEERCLSEYRTRVLQKIRRKLKSSKCNQPTAIPFEDCCWYEYDTCSDYRKLTGKRVHHIHFMFPIKINEVRRIWDEDNDCIKPTIKRDIEIIDVVFDVLIEKLRIGEEKSWYNYCNKSKYKSL